MDEHFITIKQYDLENENMFESVDALWNWTY